MWALGQIPTKMWYYMYCVLNFQDLPWGLPTAETETLWTVEISLRNFHPYLHCSQPIVSEAKFWNTSLFSYNFPRTEVCSLTDVKMTMLMMVIIIIITLYNWNTMSVLWFCLRDQVPIEACKLLRIIISLWKIPKMLGSPFPRTGCTRVTGWDTLWQIHNISDNFRVKMGHTMRAKY